MIIISYTYYITSILEIMVLMNKFVLKIIFFDLLKLWRKKIVHEYASVISIFYFYFSSIKINYLFNDTQRRNFLVMQFPCLVIHKI